MTQPLIELADLGFAWPGQAQLLDIPHFTLAPGETLFLKGPSGSGKTTLLGLLGGVQRAQSGHIRLLGQDIGQLSAGARDRFRVDHTGYIFQQFNLLPFLSVRENVELPCRFSRLRAERARQRHGSIDAAAAALLDHLGLRADLLGRRADELSIGQQQRVAAARALIGQPELVIADEPTSALDFDAREAFLQLLFAECQPPAPACCSSATTRVWPRCSTAACRWANSIAPPSPSRSEMHLIRIALASLANRRFTALLTVFAIALSVCLLLAVERVRTEARASFANTISGTDLIVGARSGSVNLLLYSVFRIGNATNNIRWDSFEHFANHRQVKWAIPISLGDSHRGYRVMGTSTAYFEHYRYARSQALKLAQWPRVC